MKQNNKQNLELQLELESIKERLNKREIWINGAITDALVSTLYIKLLKLYEANPDEDIKVMINSSGGSFYESAVATDMMGTIPNPVKTIGMANVLSGGFIIFMGGQERIVHDHTCLMMHSASFGAIDKVDGIRNRVDYTNYSLEKISKF